MHVCVQGIAAEPGRLVMWRSITRYLKLSSETTFGPPHGCVSPYTSLSSACPALSSEQAPTMWSLAIASVLLLGRAEAAAGSIYRQAPLRYEQNATTPTCKCFPGDACYPAAAEWSSLNTTVQGRLVATIPLGSPCHDPNYDEEECAYLQDQWTYSGIQ